MTWPSTSPFVPEELEFFGAGDREFSESRALAAGAVGVTGCGCVGAGAGGGDTDFAAGTFAFAGGTFMVG